MISLVPLVASFVTKPALLIRKLAASCARSVAIFHERALSHWRFIPGTQSGASRRR